MGAERRHETPGSDRGPVCSQNHKKHEHKKKATFISLVLIGPQMNVVRTEGLCHNPKNNEFWEIHHFYSKPKASLIFVSGENFTSSLRVTYESIALGIGPGKRAIWAAKF
jgi:hypothetical protein